MNDLVRQISQAVGWFLELVIAPVSGLDPFWGLLLASLLSGIVLLLIYGQVSNQRAIRNVKRAIHSRLLEAILYRHDLRISLRAQVKMLGNGALYFLYAVPPLIILLVPCVAIMAELNLRYGQRAFESGDSGVLNITLEPGVDIKDVSLEIEGPLNVTPPVRISESHQIFWRLEPSTDRDLKLDSAQLKIKAGEESITQPLMLGRQNGRIASKAFKQWWWNFLYPNNAIAIQPSSFIRELSIKYPEQSYSLLGFNANWMAVFLVFSLLSGLLASRLFKIEI